MRMVQFIGLHERATKLITLDPILIHTDFIERKFPDGRIEKLVHPCYGNPIKWKTGDKYFYTDFSDNKCYLDVYTFPDGKVYYEAVQEIYWSSGPMIFTAFKDENDIFIENSRWTIEELNSYV